ncbi:hypothetical protein BZK31_15935 [Pseudomonas floridensis]|uniref:Type IV secretion protein Rhs n=1 Tax=Pseudomonas floridensis TaxID=1958950 RepID=A0A1X0N498_9PSED|nr:contractile injection system protein, VgrG/Pvc8 family [Pseudomonas floridensis]ORC58205.1 hypothetical protein BZK31_15935 [Pseudomonas floridensis]
MPDPASEPFFRLEIARLNCHFNVLSFTAVEAISQPYRFELEVSGNETDLGSLMLKPAFLSFNGGPQGFHGQVHGATRMHYRPGPACYRLTVGPRLACLGQRYHQRVFEGLSATQIIALVLKEHGIKENYRFDLRKQCHLRDTCFQHDESDLLFIERLCAEENIHYHFQHSRRRHELVFSEGLRGFRRAPIAAWRQFEQQPGVTRFAVTCEDTDKPDSRAQQRAQGESTLPFVSCGLLLPLAGLPERDWNHMWLITRVEHRFEGRTAQGHPAATRYVNHFQAVPWEVGFCTPPPSPRPEVPRLQCAWITGQPGELQQRDPAGRVQVQFEWAQQGPEARHTTCWLPVAPTLRFRCQGGLQVVVRFNPDDLDQPMIVATLHTGSATPLVLIGREETAPKPAPVRMQFDGLVMPGDSQCLDLSDGSRLCVEHGSDLLLQVGDSQVRFNSQAMTLVSPRIVLDSELPPFDANANAPSDPDPAH